MAHYLSDQQFSDISKSISIYSIRSISSKKLSTYSFDCGKANEYKTFLFEKAEQFDEKAISKTFVMIHNRTKELIGYFALSADTIKLTESEKIESNLSNVSFASLPAIKVGKLAINKKLSKKASRKGYGSFALDIANIKAYEALKNGIGCRFITVDVDVEYDQNTIAFYEKNGFVMNKTIKQKSNQKTISMRRDIFK